MKQHPFLAISTGPLPRMIGKKYYDFEVTLNVMSELDREDVVDGFEFQYLAEWNSIHPPLDDPTDKRFDAWKLSPKYTINQITSRLEDYNFPILSLHTNRDIGKLLCSSIKDQIDEGILLCHQSFDIAEKIRARQCVFHIWDPLSPKFDLNFLQQTLHSIANQYPTIKPTVENIPTSIPNFTPIRLLKEFEWITLDLRWAAMYNELMNFKELKNHITNIHLRGEIINKSWTLPQASFTFEEALEIIINHWQYSGLFTLEPDGDLRYSNWQNFKAAVSSLKNKEIRKIEVN